MIPKKVLSGNVVVKSSQGSGWHQIVMNGQVDLSALYRKADYWMTHRFGRAYGEWGYKNVKQRILVEEMLFVDGKPVREEYKFHVCGGRIAYVIAIRTENQKAGEKIILDRDGRVIGLHTGESPPCDFILSTVFQRMREIAETLAQPFDFIRCDLYPKDQEIYFSELTIYPNSGYNNLRNESLKKLRNEMWDLRDSWFLTTTQSGWHKLYAEALLRKLNTMTI
jgi:hypothetical protein